MKFIKDFLMDRGVVALEKLETENAEFMKEEEELGEFYKIIEEKVDFKTYLDFEVRKNCQQALIAREAYLQGLKDAQKIGVFLNSNITFNELEQKENASTDKAESVL